MRHIVILSFQNTGIRDDSVLSSSDINQAQSDLGQSLCTAIPKIDVYTFFFGLVIIREEIKSNRKLLNYV